MNRLRQTSGGRRIFALARADIAKSGKQLRVEQGKLKPHTMSAGLRPVGCDGVALRSV